MMATFREAMRSVFDSLRMLDRNVILTEEVKIAQ